MRDEDLSLEDVLITRELSERPGRAPDYARESDAMQRLAASLADARGIQLDRLGTLAREVCHADSATVTMLDLAADEAV